MVKYYRYNYDRRLGGEFIELFDNSIKKAQTIKEPDSLSWQPSADMEEIVSRFDTTATIKRTVPLSGNWLKVVGKFQLSNKQLENIGRRIR